MALHIVNEANRCLSCKNPMCQKGCPIQTPIPEIIRMFKNHEVAEAGKKLFSNNPLSLICSIVCDHEMQCAGNCVLGKKGQPIHFSSIESYISDTYLDRMEIPSVEKNGMDVAVIGSGPAGMTVAFEMIRNGYGVTIFEEKDEIGGVLRYGIPEFRLPKTILKRYEKLLQNMGVKIRPNTVIGSALEIKDLFRDGFKTVFIGTGVGKPNTLGIRGESLSNVHFGINYLANPSAYHLGESIAIIGMGNTAMDVARTALRNGVRHVRLYARGKRISASSNEIAYAELDGAEFVFGKSIFAIEKDGPVFQTSIVDENDKVIGYEDELDHIKADSTIIAVSQGPKNKLILTTEGLKGSENGLLIVDENGMTTCEGVFAAGDVVHGAKTVVHAAAEAKKTAKSMIRYMQK